MTVDVGSEYGRLEAVVVHSPGREIESVSPSRASESLYNDVLPMAVVRREHEKLVEFLRHVATVYEFRDLLVGAAGSLEGRRELADIVTAELSSRRVAAEISRFDARRLIESAVEGAAARPSSLGEFLDASLFSITPVPNLYFMRDVAMVIGCDVFPGKMAHRIRRRESRLAELVFKHAPDLAGCRLVSTAWAIADRADDGQTLEGGDVLVLGPDELIIGVSERTNAAGIDALISSLLARRGRDLVVYAVLLPKSRATIHLDMVFTLLDDGVALIHEPVIAGPDAVPAVRARYGVGREPTFERYDNLLRALEVGGTPISPIVCGGSDRLRQQREQWLSGTNAFAFAPGKVIAYDCNVATLEALSTAGFVMRSIDDFLSGGESVDAYDRLVVSMSGSDLARGGGGPRCMTLPIRRAAV